MTIKTLSKWLMISNKSKNESVSISTLTGESEAKRRLFSRALDAAAVDQKKILVEYQRMMQEGVKK